MEFLFLNPTPNMEILAKVFTEMGRSTFILYNRDFIPFCPENIWAFLGGEIRKVDEKKPYPEIDRNVSSVKKPVLAALKYRYVRKKLAAIHPVLEQKTFQDYILLSAPLWKSPQSPTISNLSFEEVAAQYPSSILITSSINAPDGNHFFNRWKTDYDIKEALGGDYFIFYDEKGRNQFFCDGTELVTVSSYDPGLDWLKKAYPTAGKFSFENVESSKVHINKNPWLQKYSHRTYLVNDYSLNGLSVKMPQEWATAIAKILCIPKKKK